MRRCGTDGSIEHILALREHLILSPCLRVTCYCAAGQPKAHLAGFITLFREVGGPGLEIPSIGGGVAGDHGGADFLDGRVAAAPVVGVAAWAVVGWTA